VGGYFCVKKMEILGRKGGGLFLELHINGNLTLLFFTHKWLQL